MVTSMDSNPKPARAVKPGDILREELDERGWTQKDFAEIIGRPVQVVNEVISGKKSITPETACLIAAALSTSPQLWLNLESSYRLWMAEANLDTSEIARRAERYSRREQAGSDRGSSRTPFRVDILIEQKVDGYVAHCMQLDLAASAPTERATIDALLEQVKTRLEAAAQRGGQQAFQPAPPEAWLKLWRVYSDARHRCLTRRISSVAPIQAVICRAS